MFAVVQPLLAYMNAHEQQAGQVSQHVPQCPTSPIGTVCPDMSQSDPFRQMGHGHA